MRHHVLAEKSGNFKTWQGNHHKTPLDKQGRKDVSARTNIGLLQITAERNWRRVTLPLAHSIRGAGLSFCGLIFQVWKGATVTRVSYIYRCLWMVPALPYLPPAWDAAKPTSRVPMGHWERGEHGFTLRWSHSPGDFPGGCGFPTAKANGDTVRGKWAQSKRSSDLSVVWKANARTRNQIFHLKMKRKNEYFHQTQVGNQSATFSARNWALEFICGLKHYAPKIWAQTPYS